MMKENLVVDQEVHVSAGYEKKDVNLKVVALFAFVTIAVLVGFLVILNEYFLIEKEDVIAEQVLTQNSPALQEVRQRDEEILTTYKLLDADKGIYRIPIDRAMQLLAAEANTETK